MKFVFILFVITLFSCIKTGHNRPIKYKDNKYRVIGSAYSSQEGIDFAIYMKDSRLTAPGSTVLGIIDCLVSDNIDCITMDNNKVVFRIVDKNFNTVDDITGKSWRLILKAKIIKDEYKITYIRSSVEGRIEDSGFKRRKIKCAPLAQDCVL